MAYQDPYDAQYGRNQPQYRTTSPEQFNPYANNQPVTQAPYGQAPYADYNAGYRDEPNDEYYQQQQRRPTYDPPTGAPEPQVQYAVAKSEAPSGFESGEFTPREKTAHDLRAYRYESQGRLWTKGSRAGCITRFFCCTLLITIFVFASIVLALALWIRPPSVIIGDIYQPATGSQFQLTDNGVKINFNLNVSVNNPNYFSVDLKRVKTDLFYPINNTNIGGGVTNDIVFESNSNKTVSFPFSIDYTTELDPSNAILLDLLQKCGILGTASDITVDYELTLSIRILLITVSPKISNSFSFTCPLDSSSLSDLMGNSGMDLGDILGGTG